MRPLEGMTVVSMEHAIAAPFCTRQLADQGARVIKIERPGSGDFARSYDDRVRGLASHFVWINRSKESLTLDVKHADAADILDRLIAKADVLVQNLGPGAAARLGLSYPALREKYPRLIVCDISGYGDSGPYRDKKAYDLLIQSESGMSIHHRHCLKILARPATPLRISPPACTRTAIFCSRCWQRGRTGRGCRIDVSLLESMTEWMGFPLYYAFEGAAPPPRTGAAHATIYPYGPFPAGDGKVVMLGLQNEREWSAFCEKVLRQPQLAAEARFGSNKQRVAARDELYALIVETFSKLTAEQVSARLDEAQIANARVNEMHEVWAHEQLKARQRWVEVDTPAGGDPRAVAAGSAGRIHTHEWIRCRRSVSTPKRYFVNLGMTTRWSRSCARSAQSEQERFAAMSYEQILYSVKDRIATITLHRPEQLNAWTDVMSEEVWQAMHAADADEDVRVIVLTGSGRAFCAGGDVTGFKSDESTAADRQAAAAVRLQPPPGLPESRGLFSLIVQTYHRDVERRDRRPGAGARVVLRFALRGGRCGASPLPSRALASRPSTAWPGFSIASSVTRNAFDLLLSARKVKGQEALRLGLVNNIYPQDELVAATYAYARDLADSCSPRSLRVMKRQLWDLPFQTLQEARHGR